MKPDRSNYEIWIIDWLDGNLTEEQETGLKEFLAGNPDLLEEAEMAAQSKLVPQDTILSSKSKLFRKITELPLSQIEHLSVACLEKDITRSELAELEIILASDPQKKLLFDKVQKTRLHPQAGKVFRYKRELLRKENLFIPGTRQRIWLSSAAAIALLVISLFLVPRNNSTIMTVTGTEDLSSETREPVILQKYAFTDPSASGNTNAGSEISPSVKADPLVENVRVQESSGVVEIPGENVASALITEVSRIDVLKPYRPSVRPGTYTLTALNINVPDIETDYDGTRLGRFIARNFREKILNVDNPVEDPLKPYEIAEAGIEGLNKLLGWEMALVQNTDESGDLKSVYFSSKILKFNSPVKKTSPAP